LAAANLAPRALTEKVSGRLPGEVRGEATRDRGRFEHVQVYVEVRVIMGDVGRVLILSRPPGGRVLG
jgi:hypothetical protein